MPHGMDVGLGPGPGHIALDGDPASLSKGVHQLQLFGPRRVLPNGRLSQQLLSSCYRLQEQLIISLMQQDSHAESTYFLQLVS